MKVLLIILLVMFYVVFHHAHTRSSNGQFRLPVLAATILLCFLLFVQLRFFSEPPLVNYAAIGWQGQIRAINEQLKSQGVTNRLPEVEGK